MPLLVTGYHGCHMDTADNIVSGVGFRPSQNGYDWLGEGIYFWEDGPSRAAEWARKRFGKNGAIIQATIRLGHCLNLLDTTHFDRLEHSYLAILSSSRNFGFALPKNAGKRHELDYMVVEYYCEDFIATGAKAFDTIRGCFPEGAPLYTGSKILRETHIQVAVRDPNCISEVSVVH